MSDFLQNQRVIYADDSRVRHQGILTIKQEDHSLGNLVRHQLLENPRVKFSGYRKPHPLEEHVEIKVFLSIFLIPFQVQTNGEVAPPTAIIQAADQLYKMLQKLNESLLQQAQLFRGDVTML
ncbi:rna polymerase ii core subunit [Stylonychia lemnae]|uniref:Rna polymerase ii core subunit n=1 Tax=Stylonychia lemnae TaxID=5949 RepID=A0A078AQD5_STYLE|nr:rna polymerase ii core subunit [Stylonychia lemnae]|eukprot:CDW83457.1 rna polymerase ii core subunit [Stylonychia lemnae]